MGCAFGWLGIKMSPWNKPAGRKGSTKGVAIELWNVLVRASPDVVFISFLSEEEPGYQNSRH